MRGTHSQYTITQTATGVFQVVGPDGTDTLTAVEFLQFYDQTLRQRPGTGVSVNFNTADRTVYQSAMNAIRDFDGNALSGNGGWLRIGQDCQRRFQNDLRIENINRVLGAND